jgi:transposase
MIDGRGHGSKLGRRKELLIASLLQTDTIAEAAAQAGVSVPTVSRWMKLPEFQKAYREAVQDLVDRATRRLVRSMDGAAGKLERIMNDPQTPVGVQLSAAVKILERGSDANWEENIKSRIDELERQQLERP